MTIKDRTSEFNTIAENIRAKQANNKGQWKGNKKSQKSHFMLCSSQIGKDIFETTEKLNKLAKLAKKNSLFDNPIVEIEELTAIIKQDIQNLNKQIGALKQMAQENASNQQGEAHSKKIINYLNYKLADATKGFKDVLEVRTENLKHQTERKNRLIGAAMGPITPPPVHQSRFSAESYDSPSYERSTNEGKDVVIMMPLDQDRQHTSSRAAAVESIEKTLSELQNIFGDLMSLVAEQGDMIQRLDANIDNTALYVDRGHNELLKHLYNISSNRGLMIKLFIVLIVFMVLFVVFIV